MQKNGILIWICALGTMFECMRRYKSNKKILNIFWKNLHLHMHSNTRISNTELIFIAIKSTESDCRKLEFLLFLGIKSESNKYTFYFARIAFLYSPKKLILFIFFWKCLPIKTISGLDLLISTSVETVVFVKRGVYIPRHVKHAFWWF